MSFLSALQSQPFQKEGTKCFDIYSSCNTGISVAGCEPCLTRSTMSGLDKNLPARDSHKIRESCCGDRERVMQERPCLATGRKRKPCDIVDQLRVGTLQPVKLLPLLNREIGLVCHIQANPGRRQT